MDEKSGLQKKKGETDLHKNCFACGSNNGMGLRLKFFKNEDGVISGSFFADPRYESYKGIIHGGIISSGVLQAILGHFNG